MAHSTYRNELQLILIERWKNLNLENNLENQKDIRKRLKNKKKPESQSHQKKLRNRSFSS